MNRKFVNAVLALGVLIFAQPVIGQVVSEVTVTAEDSSKTDSTAKKDKKKKPKGTPFEEVVEDYQKIEGLFTFYRNDEENKVYMAILPGQFDKLYLMNISRDGGDGYLFDGGAMLQEFPFFLKKVGKTVQFIEKNTRFRADNTAAIRRALERDIPNSLWQSVKITGEPHPQTGAVLVDASELFIDDVADVSSLSARMKLGYSLDKSNSYFTEIKSFPQNSEISVILQFKGGKERSLITTLANQKSMTHRYHYSIFELPTESSYRPRIADDRVGHFTTMYQDYTSALREDPYERYITRWHLEKAEPKFEKSKPRRPIVFWLENTIPVAYREAVKEGVLLWNKAFERIGFVDAIEVRQMPDDADWDPADARYNTVRWIVQPGQAYAVGPSRANPFTGEIYDADIRISADFVRAFYIEKEQVVKPTERGKMTINDLIPGLSLPDSVHPETLVRSCNYAAGLSHQFRLGYFYLQSQGPTAGDTKVLEQYVHDAIVHLVAHEVGHTLGLRHNFKASAIYDPDKLQDVEFARQNGLTGSVMDYTPVNLSPKGEKQGAYYQTTLGPYDYWAIEYAYKPYDGNSPESERKFLEDIARRAGADERLQYGTDEDAFGLSVRSIDPTCNLWDIGDNPLAFSQKRIRLAKDLWQNLDDVFEKKGERYPRLRQIFFEGINEYAIAGLTAAKFIGGIYHRRDHIGDPGNRLPLEVVPAAQQRRALQFLIDTYFLPNSFSFDPALLNKLAPERNWDFEGTPFLLYRLDFPIHGYVQVLQSVVLFRIFDPLALVRLQDNEVKVNGRDKFTMAEQFAGIRDAIWQEVKNGQNVNSYRREVQRMHVYVLDQIVNKSPVFFPHDAVALARYDLGVIRNWIEQAMTNNNLDVYTKAHLQEMQAKIDALLNARMQRFY
jgi:hypothetical protein